MSITSTLAIIALAALSLGAQLSRTPSLFVFDLLDRIFTAVPPRRR